jgi:hypothetical protein
MPGNTVDPPQANNLCSTCADKDLFKLICGWLCAGMCICVRVRAGVFVCVCVCAHHKHTSTMISVCPK